MKVHMKEDELELFTETLQSATNYLEFGMGGSTVLARKILSGVIASVDSSMEWVELVKQAILSNGQVLESNTKLIFADIGPTGKWGYPLDTTNMEIFNNYHEKYISRIENVIDFDLVLIDGRFRVACCALASQMVNQSATFVIHDYRSRPHYHIVEEFLIPTREVSDLTVFKILPNAQSEAKKIFEKYKFEAS